MSDVVAVVPVGPDDKELHRTARLVDSLVRHESGLKRLVLLIDGVSEATLRPYVRPGPLDVRYITNPRNGRGLPVYDGLACGLTKAYGAIAAELPGAHAWKIDTDALVLRPVSRQIADFLDARPAVGMAGTYETNPGGASREREFVPGVEVARKFLRPIWYWRTSGAVSSPYFGRFRLFAKWIRQAHAAGLPWGWHVQGGSYAVNATVLAHWLRTGRLAEPERWLGAPMSEDVGFSHWAVIDGFELAGFNGPGDAFGVSGTGLPMPTDALLAANYGVVHSLKVGDWDAERALADELVRRTGGG